MNLYSKRRERILKAVKANCAFMFFSGKAPMRSEDDAYEFSVNRNFYYLTGLDAENMVLLMSNIDGVLKETLFILPYDELLAKWVGGRMLPEDASTISDIQDVLKVDELDSTVATLIEKTRKDNAFKMYFDMWHYNMDQELTPAINYANMLKNKYPYLIIKDSFPIITSSRLVKDKIEIGEIKKAIHMTNLGVQQMMKTAKPGVNEMAMEGVFDFVLRQAMCRENAFATIAASGEKATILHYRDNNKAMADGELFLCDLGATSNHYCADISRTFPVNGKFSVRQKELYDIVLGAQKIVEENAKVGIKLKDLNQMVIDYYKIELPKHGLNKDVKEYYFHSVSHHIGLDVHDVNGGLGDTLQTGNVISNEPGLYVADEGIGIRIEDDLLITGTGVEVLSKEIIKTTEEIEAFMNGQQ